MSLYDDLFLSPSSTQAEIKQQYQYLSRNFHPDKQESSSQSSGEQFRKISAAYKTLSDPASRAFYDKYGTEAPGNFNEQHDSRFSLLPKDKKFLELERRAKLLLAEHEEMQAQQFLSPVVNSNIGFKYDPRRNRIRKGFSTLTSSVTASSHAHSLSLVSVNHVQSNFQGVSRISVIYTTSWWMLDVFRVTANFPGTIGIEGERRLDEWNNVKIGVEPSSKSAGTVNISWTHKLSRLFAGVLGVNLGLTNSVSLELAKKPERNILLDQSMDDAEDKADEYLADTVRGKLKFELSSSDAFVEFKPKINVNKSTAISLGPRIGLSGFALELGTSQILDELSSLTSSSAGLKTVLHWGFAINGTTVESVTYSVKISRGGFGFNFPLEIPMDESENRFALLAVFLAGYAFLPLFAGQGIRKVYQSYFSLNTKSEDLTSESTESSLSSGDMETIKKIAKEKRASSDLKIISAYFEEYDVTDLVMARVFNNRLVISNAPKHLIFGESAKDKNLVIVYSNQNQPSQKRQTFKPQQPVMLP
jgi:DnaJ domain